MEYLNNVSTFSLMGLTCGLYGDRYAKNGEAWNRYSRLWKEAYWAVVATPCGNSRALKFFLEFDIVPGRNEYVLIFIYRAESFRKL